MILILTVFKVTDLAVRLRSGGGGDRPVSFDLIEADRIFNKLDFNRKCRVLHTSAPEELALDWHLCRCYVVSFGGWSM